MTNQIEQITIIGLPRSGKTTFIAALWHLLVSGDIDATKLTLSRIEGDVKHLNTIADCWRQCKEIPRTSFTNEAHVYIYAVKTDTNLTVRLGLPDFSGETFTEHQISNRKCTKEYLNDFEKEGSIMLFITADSNHNDSTLIEDMNFFPNKETSSEETSSEVQNWESKYIPTAVKLVELLQFLLHPPFNNRIKRKLAIVISAWDVVGNGTGENISPTDWFRKMYPMLDQFLECNNDMFEFRVYGISAQGGDLNKDKDDLLAKYPSERIQCYGHESSGLHDITAPIHWLMRE